MREPAARQSWRGREVSRAVTLFGTSPALRHLPKEPTPRAALAPPVVPLWRARPPPGAARRRELLACENHEKWARPDVGAAPCRCPAQFAQSRASRNSSIEKLSKSSTTASKSSQKSTNVKKKLSKSSQKRLTPTRSPDKVRDLDGGTSAKGDLGASVVPAGARTVCNRKPALPVGERGASGALFLRRLCPWATPSIGSQKLSKIDER